MLRGRHVDQNSVIVTVELVLPFVRDCHVEIAVTVGIECFEILRARLGAALRPARLGLVAKAPRPVVDERAIDADVARQEIGRAVGVEIEHDQRIRDVVRRQPLTRIREAPRAVVQVELVLAIVFADEHEIEIAIAVEVGECDVLAVVLRARQLGRRIAEKTPRRR